MLRDGDTYTLSISETYGEDADEYVCRASNKGGSRTSRAQLLIKSKFFPNFEINQENMIIVTFQQPLPISTFLRDSEILLASKRVKMWLLRFHSLDIRNRS